MSINNINRSTPLTEAESTKVNQKQLSDNTKNSKLEQTNLPTDKSNQLIANSKIQEGNFTASYQSTKLQNMIPSNTSSNTNTKGINVKYEAEQIVKANTEFLDLDEAKLGKTLATVSKEQPNLVKETLSQLSQSDKVQVTQAFVDELRSKGRLKDLAKTPEGNKLLLEAYNTLSGQSGFLKNSDPRLELIGSTLANVAKEKASQTQPQNASSNKVAPSPQAKIEGSKARELPLNAIPKQGNPEIRYELPIKGEGYYVYNRNDTKRDYRLLDKVAPELVGNRVPDQVGTKETIGKIEILGREWNKLHPDKPIRVGDISLPGGVDTLDHATHQDGQTVDIRPFRTDNIDKGVTYGNKKEYDQQLTREFIQFVLEKYPEVKIYFNDPQLIKEFPDIISKKPAHNDHLHLGFSPGKGW